MEQYTVTGMSCASCSTAVEKAVSGVGGVTSCSVNLLTDTMTVEGTASDSDIISAVERAGYGAFKKVNDADRKSDEHKDTQLPALAKRLTFSAVFLAVLMYFSMGHMMWGWYIPGFFAKNHVAQGILQLLLSSVILVINQKFFISGFKSLIKRSPNMDTLVALGSGASFLYSVYALFAMTEAQIEGNHAAMEYMNEFYFESAAMILTLITLGKMLEEYSKGRTTDALKGLMKLAPKTAVLIRGGREVKVLVQEVKKGDVFVVRPGENIPVDGVIIEGSSAVNEAALTGESIPADKEKGDTVSAATVNQSGFIRCEAVRVGEDTTLSQIIKMVNDASSEKAPIAKAADKVSGYFVPVVIIIAVVTVLVWLACGQSVGFALARGISVLVINCPCALGLATPVAIMVGNGVGAKNGILFKTASSLEETGKIKTAVLDKTGTITRGEPEVTDMYPANGVEKNTLLQIACSLENKSEHPLAAAVVKKAAEEGVDAAEVINFTAVAGSGLTAELDGRTVVGGNINFVGSKAVLDDDVKKLAEKLADKGKTPLFFCCDGKFLGIIAVSDTIRQDSPQAVKELQSMGIRVIMLTGDNRRTAEAIGVQAGVDEVISDVMPDGKESTVRRLQQNGKVVMVGDGINDAPALTRADIGIAVGAGTDIAIDAADVVLMRSRLSDVPSTVRLSRAVLRNIHENLFWAFIYNVIGIPLAAGVFIPLFNLRLNPMFAAAAMSLSSFCVVANALRLNFVSLGSKKR